MVYSENPYVDIVVYNVKNLGIGTVLKLQDVANKKETLQSKKNADMLLMCMEGTLTYDLIPSLNPEVLRKSGITDEITMSKCLLNPLNVPINLRDIVLKNFKTDYIENYVELNEYYRMLNGLPPVGYKDIYTDWTPTDGVVLDTSIPVHMMSFDALTILDMNGVLEDMYNEDRENRAYLKYVLNPIDPYTARKVGPFGVLHIPSTSASDIEEIYNDYRERLTINRTFTLQTVYSEAYKYESDYYDNFIAIFIILNAMCDVIARTNEFITRKEVFDIRTVRYIFESHGVTYFPEIPMKYQVRMVKNLHMLIKFKSTPKCMIDICSLFGFENITIFKYYLFKSRKYDRANNEYSFTGDPEEDFEIKFVKIPIDEPMEDYIRNTTYHYDYDEIVAQDPTWNGGLEHDYVKKQHLEASYNYTRTKYLSVDSMYELAKVTAQQCYFFNMLYDNVKLETEINLSIPYISPAHKFNIVDIFVFLHCLTCQYYNRKDLMLDTQSKILTVNGFNFKADLATIAADLEQMGYTLEAKEMFEKFNIPTDSIPNLTQLMNLFINNMDVREVLVAGMRNADNLRVYNTYKYLYDSLMEIQLTMKYFQNEDGEFYRDEEGDATYIEWLKRKDPILYYKLVEIDYTEDEESKTQMIANIIDNVVYILENYIDTEEFSGLFHNLPVVSVEAVKEYIRTVIDFYKSYKVHFLGVNTIYVFDDKNEGWVKIIDWIILNRYFEKDEIVPIIEKIFEMKVDMTKKDKVDIIERVYLDIRTWVYHNFVEKARPKDRDYITSILNPKSVMYLTEGIDTTVRYKPDVELRLIDWLNGINNTYKFEEKYFIKDKVFISELPWYVDVTKDGYRLSFDIENIVVPNTEDGIIIYDGRINENCLGEFVPLASVYDLYESAEVICGAGMAKITLINCTSDSIVGTLNVSGPFQ